MSENSIEVAQAFEVIKQAMIDDDPSVGGSYAHSWHCNIAMMCVDAILTDDEQRISTQKVGHDTAHEIGNDAASRFMKLCFGVETKN